MTERPNVPVLKTGVGLPTVGSNPTPSAQRSRRRSDRTERALPTLCPNCGSRRARRGAITSPGQLIGTRYRSSSSLGKLKGGPMTSPSTAPSAPLIVYGASWCPDCRRAKQFLSSHRTEFEWIDLEEFPDRAVEVEQRNQGKRIIPTIVFSDDSFLAEPTNDELADRIGLNRAAMSREYDLVIVGAGPTGLTTSIYGARESAKVLIVEKSAPGGQAGVTERFDNYPGFPDGVGGTELAERMTRQAEKYGVEILQAVGVTSIVRDGPMLRVNLSTDDFVLAPVVLVASGSTYRRTGADGEADLIGAGIHFCATCDGPF